MVCFPSTGHTRSSSRSHRAERTQARSASFPVGVSSELTFCLQLKDKILPTQVHPPPQPSPRPQMPLPPRFTPTGERGGGGAGAGLRTSSPGARHLKDLRRCLCLAEMGILEEGAWGRDLIRTEWVGQGTRLEEPRPRTENLSC